MIPVASILSIVGGVIKGISNWLNSAAGNMFKGWIKGRKDQQRIDTIKHQEATLEVQHKVEEAREHVPDRSSRDVDDWLRRGR